MAQERFKSNLEFRYQIIVSSIKFRKGNPFLGELDLYIPNNIVSSIYSKLYGTQDDFKFEIVDYPFVNGDDPRSSSHGIYSSLIRFARVCSDASDLNNKHKCFTAKLLKQGYQCHNIRYTFSIPVTQ